MGHDRATPHRIIEKPTMEFPPFGLDACGKKIRDVSGVTVRANVDYLEETVGNRDGPEAGVRAVEELCALLNGRIPDPAYRVSPAFLKNVWHSYSYEFVMFLGEFAADLSGDPRFHYNVGREKFLTPLIQTLGRPFTVAQIYRLFPHFGEKFAKDSLQYDVRHVSERRAILRLTYTEGAYRQFGPYQRRCTYLVCQSAKASLAAVPARIHGLLPARIRDLSCVAEGDEACEWEFTWDSRRDAPPLMHLGPWLLGGSLLGYVAVTQPAIGACEAAILTLLPAAGAWVTLRRRRRQQERDHGHQLIHEQLRAVEARHEELREAYLEQEESTVQLRRTVSRLATLHRLGLAFTAVLDRGILIRTVLTALVEELRYDCALLSFYDPFRGVSHDAHVYSASETVRQLARSIGIPCVGADSLEAQVLLEGRALIAEESSQQWERLHPLHRRLATLLGARTVLLVPVRSQDRSIGLLALVPGSGARPSHLDSEMLTTVAAQVAVALDNAAAYRQIEALNAQLEGKVAERTAALELANRELAALNEALTEANRVKSAFVSIASHELRTPLASIKGYLQNLLDGVTGPLTEKQVTYLRRVHHNTDRLARMVQELLDLSRLESGAVELRLTPLALDEVVQEALEELRPLAAAKRLELKMEHERPGTQVLADRDKLLQVLTNLLHNALTFTPQGQIRVATARQGHEVQISVLDEGPGLREEEIVKLFLKFYRGSSVPPGSAGAGLGLAIAKALVELQGGRIWAEPRRCGGACFSFTLPAASSD